MRLFALFCYTSMICLPDITWRKLYVIYYECVDDRDVFVLFDDPALELFLWSVLMRRQDLAVCFWEEGKVKMSRLSLWVS